MKYLYDDCGRNASGYTENNTDCVVRAIAIATEKSYDEVCNALGYNGQNGILRSVHRKYLKSLGWKWVRKNWLDNFFFHELPKGRLIVQVPKHLTAVIDQVIHDTDNPYRDDMCITGYYQKA